MAPLKSHSETKRGCVVLHLNLIFKQKSCEGEKSTHTKKMTTKSLPDIGRRFSGRDHTTVIHAIKKVEALMIQDKNFENEVKDLNQKLTKTV